MFNHLLQKQLVFLSVIFLGFFQPLRAQKLPKLLKKAFDFSLAGYHQGQTLPGRSREAKTIFKVEDFGAVPNDGKDDIDAIQKAVDAAEQVGGGVVLFPRGTFDFDVETSQRFVHVKKSNIVIRGWGDGIEGTVLHDHHASRSPDPSKIWLGGVYPSFFKVGNPLKDLVQLTVVAKLKPAKVGAVQVLLFENGKPETLTYILSQDNPADSSLAKELTFPLREIGEIYVKTGIKYAQMVRVLKVENNLATLDAPIHWRLDAKWNPRLLAIPQMIEETGIENFRLITEWVEPFIHHHSDIHDSGWDHIQVSCLENGWFRNIVHDSPSQAIGMNWAKNCVVSDCQIIGNRGHNGFGLAGGSTSNLLFNLKGGNTMHTYTLNNYGSGNVFYQCITNAPSAIDCHGSLCHNNLFDNIYGAVVQHGGNNVALPPAHARGLVFYNFNMGYENAYNQRIKSDILAFKNYPGVTIYGAQSQLGFTLQVRDEFEELHENDFNSAFGDVQKLNFAGRLAVPSLYIWQYKKRYGFVFALEPKK